MQIIIDGKVAALKQGSSFDFVAENRMFSGSDSYTLTITFPLKDCPRNLEIFGDLTRSELPVDDYVYDCEIRDRAFSRFGTLTITEISDVDVKAQFLEGRAEQNFAKDFDETYVNELDLGSYPSSSPTAVSPEQAWNPAYTDWQAVALPWVSADSGTPHNFADYDKSSGKYSWTDDVAALSWQPYLIHIVRRICEAVGYTCDLSEWEADSVLNALLVCNTLPDAWEVSGYARALPHWTVDEFFEKLELFLRGEFCIDHRACHISFRFFRSVLEQTPPVLLEQVVDEYSSTVDTEGDKCEYLEAKAFKYKDQPMSVWRYLSCDWLLSSLKPDGILHYADYYSMYQDNKSHLAYDDKGGNHRHPNGSNVGKVLHVEDTDMYYILRNISRRESGKDDMGRTTYVYTRILQPINELGAHVPEGADIDDAEELEYVPACVDFTEEDYGNVLFLSFSGYGESSVSSTSGDILSSFDDDEFQKTGLQQMIEAGEKESPSDYYDVVNLGIYWGYHKPGWVCPLVSGSFDSALYERSLRINDGADPRWTTYHRIDRTRKVSFKFLSDDIPDPRAVFFIRGRRYVCEKITATFAENGMSQLLKGEFWPLLDD